MVACKTWGWVTSGGKLYPQAKKLLQGTLGPPSQNYLSKLFSDEGILMAEKKQDSFVVNDRRLFNSEGELRKDTTEEQIPVTQPVATPPAPPQPQVVDEASVPAPPTTAEQEQQADAYRKS